MNYLAHQEMGFPAELNTLGEIPEGHEGFYFDADRYSGLPSGDRDFVKLLYDTEGVLAVLGLGGAVIGPGILMFDAAHGLALDKEFVRNIRFVCTIFGRIHIIAGTMVGVSVTADGLMWSSAITPGMQWAVPIFAGLSVALKSAAPVVETSGVIGQGVVCPIAEGIALATGQGDVGGFAGAVNAVTSLFGLGPVLDPSLIAVAVTGFEAAGQLVGAEKTPPAIRTASQERVIIRSKQKRPRVASEAKKAKDAAKDNARRRRQQKALLDARRSPAFRDMKLAVTLSQKAAGIRPVGLENIIKAAAGLRMVQEEAESLKTDKILRYGALAIGGGALLYALARGIK